MVIRTLPQQAIARLADHRGRALVQSVNDWLALSLRELGEGRIRAQRISTARRDPICDANTNRTRTYDRPVLAHATRDRRLARTLRRLASNRRTEEDAIMRRRRGGLLGTAARTAVIAGTASAVSGKVGRKQNAAHQAAAGGASSDRISQLERLNELKKSGALTKDEFQREKAKLLG
jgi:hypothetical protein